MYELLGIKPPDVLKGYPQSPIEGESFAGSLTDAGRPRARRPSSTPCSASARIYHQGWLACTVHPPISGWGHFESDVWELYDLDSDRAQSTGHGAPGAGAAREAEGDSGTTTPAATTGSRSTTAVRSSRSWPSVPRPGPDRKRYEYYPDASDVPEFAGVAINGRPYAIAAGVRIDVC